MNNLRPLHGVRQGGRKAGSRLPVLAAAMMLTNSGCAIATDGALAFDPIAAYIFLLLAIAAAAYLLSVLGQAMAKTLELIGQLITIAARFVLVAVLLGAVLTVAACTALT